MLRFESGFQMLDPIIIKQGKTVAELYQVRKRRENNKPSSFSPPEPLASTRNTSFKFHATASRSEYKRLKYNKGMWI